MRITQLRNATILVEAAGHGIVVDPMLGPRGSQLPFKWITRNRRRNPLVDLPANSAELLERATHCLISHSRKGHWDHLDDEGVAWLKERDIPVYSTEDEQRNLTGKGLRMQVLKRGETTDFLGGTITPIPSLHGRGLVGALMTHGSGYVIRLPDEPTLYLAGDTVMTDDVRACIRDHHPDISVIPAGGARLDVGSAILMDLDQAIEFGRLGEGVVIANHLEALDHCPVTRDALREAAISHGMDSRFRIPADGETMEFHGVR